MILITGLGPGDIARIPGPVLDLLLDTNNQLIIRTVHHPAGAQLSERRPVRFCDDLYEAHESFADVYSAIAHRVIDASQDGPVIYAVPGSPAVGEFAVRQIVQSGGDVSVLPAESFVDAILAVVEYDPLDRGLQILNGHELPLPVIVDKPTIVGHLDRPEIFADVLANIARTMPEDAEITVFSGLGASDEVVWSGPAHLADPSLAGFRTSVWIDSDPGGLVGAVRTMDRLRSECPWDREQTHQSLTKNLIEESYELIEAIDFLEADGSNLVAYARVEEEVGDVLLQVLFHSVIADQEGAFDINDAAEVLRQKLVHRHPHVFGDVDVAGPAEVKANWDAIKSAEKGSDGSALDGIPITMPTLQRAMKVLNRAGDSATEWDQLPRRIQALADELGTPGTDVDSVVGDLILLLTELSRRSGVDADRALRAAIGRFEQDFRSGER